MNYLTLNSSLLVKPLRSTLASATQSTVATAANRFVYHEPLRRPLFFCAKPVLMTFKKEYMCMLSHTCFESAAAECFVGLGARDAEERLGSTKRRRPMLE